MFKGLFSKFFITTFIIVALSSLVLVEGMPIRSQISYIATETIRTIQDVASDLGQGLSDFARDVGLDL